MKIIKLAASGERVKVSIKIQDGNISATVLDEYGKPKQKCTDSSDLDTLKDIARLLGIDIEDVGKNAASEPEQVQQTQQQPTKKVGPFGEQETKKQDTRRDLGYNV